MKKLTTGALTLMMFACLAGSAAAQLTNIDDIQSYDPVTGAITSPYTGQTVTVEGVVYVIKGTYNSGTHYIQDATGGINFFDPSAIPLTYGDRVQVTGQIGSFGGEINIVPTNYTYLGNEAEVEPLDVELGTLVNDYEYVGSLVRTIGTVSYKSGGTFHLATPTDTLICYVDSDTGIDLGAMQVGDEYSAAGPAVIYNDPTLGVIIEIKPRRQGDLVEDPTGDTVPVVENVNCVDWTPAQNDPVTVQATITDNSGISSASLFYRDDSGDSTGVFLSVPMSNVGGDLYEGTIPGGNVGRQLDFYVSATDDGAQTVTNPGDAPASWYEVALGFETIHDVQFVDVDGTSGDSSFNGRVVNIQGIVVAGTGDAGAVSKFTMQDDSAPFSGILVYEGSGANFVLPGDEVQVGGYVDEYFGLTEMQPHNGSAVEILSFENELPAPLLVATDVLSDDEFPGVDGDSNSGEAYESVWVQTPVSTVIDTVGADQYNEFMISTSGVAGDSLIVNAIIDLTYAPVPGDNVSVVGFMDYIFGERQLVPIRDENVYVNPNTAVETELPSAGGFSAIAPNPFNPKTEIRFVLTRDNLAQLNIYNIRGEFVRSLVNGRLQGGQEHVLSWDGTDAAGQQVASGTYFARLRIGGEVLQVRKLSLVK